MSAARVGVLWTAILYGMGVGPTAAQSPEVLDPAAWQADLEQLDRAIRVTHPRPFDRVAEKKLDATVERLSAEISGMSDHAIMLRLSRIAGMLHDGHTRLSLPRTHPEFILSYSHSVDPQPSDPRLRLGQLPVNLAALAGGLYVEEAVAGYEEYLGSRIVAFGGVPASEALDGAEALVSADNAGARRLLAADLLESPEVLSYLNAALRDCGVSVRIEKISGSTTDVCWPPLPEDETVVIGKDRPTYRLTEARTDGLVVLELNEITSTRERPIGETMSEAVRTAETADARLVIDLRQNTGGSNSYGRAVTLAIVRSAELNTYGRTFVLIGPRTFSAAQHLLNELERYTRVLFVGEPSGSHPDHYGDSEKIRLENSGLTLRVSTLHWSSGTSNDQRDATRPHIPIQRTAAAVFSDSDPALEAAAGYEFGGLASLITSQLLRGAPYNAANIGYYDVVSAGAPRISVDQYLRIGNRLTEKGKALPAAYAYQIGLLAYPDDPRLQSALDAARERL